MAEKTVGKSIKRTEDPRLIQGLAHYVDDIRLPDTLHAAFLRSIYAHARIKSIDTTAAQKLPGVVAVYTGKDVQKIGVVPCAAAGSLMLTPDISLAALRAMKQRYGDKIWNRYGFADAFNPNTGWVSPEVIGLDAGITLLSAENLRTGNVWKWFMANPEAKRAIELAEMK